MDKEQTLEFFEKNHSRLQEVLDSLPKETMIEYRITGTWTIKDIIAHISAWNKELIKTVDMLLRDEKPWFANTAKNQIKQSEAEYNKIQIVKRKPYSLQEILEEWQQSFNDMISKIKLLSDDDWNYTTEFYWQDGSPVSVKSLFGYRYRGEGHEGGHAKQIEEYFEQDQCACEIY